MDIKSNLSWVYLIRYLRMHLPVKSTFYDHSKLRQSIIEGHETQCRNFRNCDIFTLSTRMLWAVGKGSTVNASS